MLNKEHAWWLPPGSIRALLALAIIIPTMVVLAVNGQFAEMMSIAVIAVNFYFLKDNLSGRTASDETNQSSNEPNEG